MLAPAVHCQAIAEQAAAQHLQSKKITVQMYDFVLNFRLNEWYQSTLEDSCAHDTALQFTYEISCREMCYTGHYCYTVLPASQEGGPLTAGLLM